jgi:sec-independent protein translocase protein TatA
METLGAPELLIILALALLFFGANKLPEIGKGLGSAIKGFKAGLKEEPDAAPLPSSQSDKR